eukprot:Nk52_evm22s272 gene=Nk52_evmTU22s272
MTTGNINVNENVPEGVSFSWKNMTRSIVLPKSKDESKPKNKLLLDNVSGVVKPGELLAIMGPSGAGKSSLLDILAGRVPAAEGSSMAMNDHSLDSALELRGLSAYVPQDDNMMASLTVEEMINYSAQLRLPHDKYTAEERAEHVNDIILGLGLDRVRDSQVGGTALVRGVSGGERRRVSIGMELVTRPAVLFLDEPTSGLDSAASLQVIRMLKQLAIKEQFSVIATIHQPSTKVYELFDKTMLLAGGKTVFFGPRAELPDHFESLGYPCPQFINPADYYMDMINTDFAKVQEEFGNPDGSPVASAELLASLIESFAKSELNSDLHKEIERARSGEKSTSKFYLEKLSSSKSLSNLYVPKKTTEDDIEAGSVASQGRIEQLSGNKNVYNNSLFVETVLLTKRAFQNATRNVLLFWARVILYIQLALLMGIAWWQISDDQDHVQDRLSLLFFPLTFLSFMAVAAVPAVVEERLLFDRERANGAYRTAAYALSNWIVSVPFLAIIAVSFTSVMYFMVGLQNEADKFGLFLLNMYLVISVAEALVVLVAAVVPVFVIALTLYSFVLGFFCITQGYFIRIDNLPDYLSWAQWINFFKYGFEASVYNDFKGLTFNCAPDANVSAGYKCLYGNDPASGHFTGMDVLEEYGYEDVNTWEWFGAMVAIMVVFRVLFYAVLAYKSQPKNL